MDSVRQEASSVNLLSTNESQLKLFLFSIYSTVADIMFSSPIICILMREGGEARSTEADFQVVNGHDVLLPRLARIETQLNCLIIYRRRHSSTLGRYI